MELDKLTVGEVKSLMAMVGKKTCKTVFNGGVRIVILQRGWVAVGRYTRNGNQCRLTSAHIIRKWGTSLGLPELAFKGPLTNTVLDASPTIEFHQLTEIANIQCAEDKWLSKCPL